ncbi:glycosyltransferase [Rhizobium sp. AG855]|uniref:glycosyltransferase n=1 Tax=Rhizobium sp. AG855 TaxID=2183898 RepID=UPI000E75BEF8|nr:glycosyltransferase [Rhizobium sp. AG855]RKE83475.1 glycosyltransferase Alg8 [Rhizobium sp. AG855]
MLAHVIYLLSMTILALSVPHPTVSAVSGTLITVGLIGAWRYAWAGINLARAAYYLKFAYPRRRRLAAEAYVARGLRDHAYFLVTTYKIAPDISTRVYRSIFEAAYNAAGGATIVASIVDEADARLIRRVMESVAARHPESQAMVGLKIDKIAGTGKRDALATSLRSIARLNPGRNDIVVFVDGDSCVPIDVVDRSLPFFTDPAVGAVTTDELSDTQGGRLFRDWFDLRFSQRHVMMSSMSLSERVLTLTGRMSIFRASLATDPGFVELVRHDFIDHWRLGRVNFLTGDDKSTWFWLLQRGYKMLYLPDLCTLSIETQPYPSFFGSAIVLMTRWFGNMLRTNGRALALPASQIGYFTWWSVLDQALSIWTTLAGPASILLAAAFVSPWILPIYFAWVMFTRYGFCTVIMAFRGRSFPVTFPFLLYFSQVGGAVVKSFILFRLDRQKWTRQAASGSRKPVPVGQRWRALSSTYMHCLALGWLILGVAYVGNII